MAETKETKAVDIKEVGSTQKVDVKKWLNRKLGVENNKAGAKHERNASRLAANSKLGGA